MTTGYFTLSQRLAAVASYVEPGAKVIDVGTDHAYVPIWLLLQGICQRAYASDNKQGPLSRAAEDARRWGVEDRLTLCLCDGLTACAPEAVDTVILAGMGGDTIRGILEASPWALRRRLILQPQTHPGELEDWLAGEGVGIVEMRLACDAGRLYAVWLCLPDAPPLRKTVHPSLFRRKDPLLRSWLEERIRRTQRRLYGMEQARQPDMAAAEAVSAELEELRAALAQLDADRPQPDTGRSDAGR